MQTLPFRRWERFVLVALFALHALISFQGFFEMHLQGHQGWNASLRSTIARNYNDHGFVETGLRPYKDFYRVDDLEKANVHWHHPPGINLLVGLSFAIFGEHEASARLVPVVATLLVFFFLFFVVRRRHGPIAACCTVGVFVLLPMQIEYGKMISYEPVVVASILAALLVLERLRDGKERSPARYAAWAALLVSCVLFAGFIDWPGFIFAAFIGFDALVRKPRQPWIFVAVGVASTAFLAAMFGWLSQSIKSGGFEQLAKMRSANTSYSKLLTRTWDRFGDYYLAFVSWTAAIGLFLEARLQKIDPIVFVCVSTTVVYFAAFKQGAYIHNFYLYYIAPAVAVAAGVALSHAAKSIQPVRIVAMLGIFWGVFFVGTVYSKYEKVHNVSYRIRKSKGVLLDGGFDLSVIGKWVNQNTKPGETYLVHKSVKLSMPAKYYSGRKHKIVSVAPRSPKEGEALFIAPAHKLKLSDQKRLAKKYSVTRLAHHFIFDLRTKKDPVVSALRVETKPKSLWHSYWVSNIYPPYELTPWPKQAEKTRKKLLDPSTKNKTKREPKTPSPPSLKSMRTLPGKELRKPEPKKTPTTAD